MRVHRRCFIELLSVEALAIVGLFGCRQRPELRGFDDVVKEARRLADALRRAAPRDEEAYLASVAALFREAGAPPPIELGPPYLELMRTGLHSSKSGLVLVEWTLGPNVTYPPHDHPNYNGMTMGLDGECRIRNFAVIAEGPPLRVRETQNAVLGRGEIASVMTTRRDNIHTIETGSSGVRGLDINTLVGEHVGFSFIDLSPERGADGTHLATRRLRRELVLASSMPPAARERLRRQGPRG